MAKEKFELVATCFFGFENILEKEIQMIGATDIKKENRAVSFTGDNRVMYEANYKLRTAIKILKPIMKFEASNEEELYKKIKEVEWENIFGLQETFSVDSVVDSRFFNHSQYIALKTKDAIVDRFKEKFNRRPFIDRYNPDFRINIKVGETHCILSIDSSGSPLFKRGYRVGNVEAPLNEVVAAGLVLMSGWNRDCDFIDPMCGSGTILIEAAMYAYNIYPGVFREHFGFEKWKDFDAKILKDVIDSSDEIKFEHKIYGFDISPLAISSTRQNITKAFLTKKITVNVKDFFVSEKPCDSGIMITNPPYGERLSRNEDMFAFYMQIGDTLKKHYSDFEAYIISSNLQAMKRIGLHDSGKNIVYNGQLECRFNKYELYKGTKRGDFIEAT